MEKPKRARRRKLDTAKADLEPPLAVPGGQGVHREVESEGHEEKYRAVIDGGHPEDEPVGQRWGKVEPAVWRRRRSHSPTAPRCLRMARYGRTTCDLRRTGRVPSSIGVSDPISESEMGSDARSVVGLPNSTTRFMHTI